MFIFSDKEARSLRNIKHEKYEALKEQKKVYVRFFVKGLICVGEYQEGRREKVRKAKTRLRQGRHRAQ